MMKPRLAKVLALTAVGGLFGSMVLTAEPLLLPDWSAIFSPDGDVVDLQGGLEAIFLEDKISDGLGLDASVLRQSEETTVDNGVVVADGDLGNGYVYAMRDGLGDLVLYAGIERLESASDTHVEFEFNQAVVQVLSGAPWPIHGTRTVGDLLVRLEFTAGELTRGKFMSWDGEAYQVLSAGDTAGMPCGGVDLLHVFCYGLPPMESIQQESWDSAGTVLELRPPDGFVEFGVNVTGLLGPDVEFTSILVRTPEDIVLESFRKLGYWAQQEEQIPGGNHD
jgi:hypothetical protein